MSDLRAAALEWLAQDPDPDTRAELRAILDNDDREGLSARFGGRLEFGTAGLRGELGAGPNRMNRVTVMRAAAGLAKCLPRGGRVVVGFDARHGSQRFAHDTAAVLAGAGLRPQVFTHPIPTPVLAHFTRVFDDVVAGVMVTASHNPPRDNGYKVYWSDGAQIIPPTDAEISAAIDTIDRVDTLPLGSGWPTLDTTDLYLDAVASLDLGPPDPDLSIVYTPLHGVGRDTLISVFERAGFGAPIVVPEQADPDPDFPTVAFPNPEEPGALDLALGLAEARGADLVIANDPDADRCAVAVPHAGGWRVLTGDEVGGLLAEHILDHTTGSDRLVATTIVSSSLLRSIAAAHGVRHTETLTGFKWIMKAARPSDRLVFGYEEALGYSVGDDRGVLVNDKDGITAALTVATLAAHARRNGHTLLDLLDDQAHKYGLHTTTQLSIRATDPAQITTTMSRLRTKPPTRLGGRTVEEFDDLADGINGLPPTDGLRFRLSRRARVIIRPSGTEPKLKCYLETITPVHDDVTTTRAHAATDLNALRTDVAAMLSGAPPRSG
ncbi:phospho-sugar mutase [Actinomadura spongiicola]|uniref:Phospho-sugar mutase n=1 Tax=Actinomadura spongiicola TaxID=2303421 RepID=A0A372GGR6_9ACTN|nr:phospho-sugar mutase [Actinomadura spongiicola]RFS84571.1 phospho-sugar mutase [Actinomadura spongiicola]